MPPDPSDSSCSEPARDHALLQLSSRSRAGAVRSRCVFARAPSVPAYLSSHTGSLSVNRVPARTAAAWLLVKHALKHLMAGGVLWLLAAPEKRWLPEVVNGHGLCATPGCSLHNRTRPPQQGLQRST